MTLGALGGVEAIDLEDAASPVFPYVVSALVTEWSSLDAQHQEMARELVTTAISTTESGVALSDVCHVVVPLAADLGIAVDIKAELRNRISDRDDQRRAALAAIALRWLAHLAVLTDTARGALVDVLGEIALGPTETPQFATVAAQVAGVAYDRWRDSAAVDCLTRLIETSDSPDAWFALGQARLLEALDATDRESCFSGLEATLECFDFAAASGEQRPDSLMYANAVRFITSWAASARAEMLDDYYQNAQHAFDEYMVRGLGLTDQPGWLRPRFESETAWIDLLRSMERAADRGGSDLLWYDAATAIGALADVYRICNSFTPGRTHGNGAERLVEFVSPQLTAPFVGDVERLGYVAKWLEQVDDPSAAAFADLVRERAEGVVHPKVGPPDHIRR